MGQAENRVCKFRDLFIIMQGTNYASITGGDRIFKVGKNAISQVWVKADTGSSARRRGGG